MAIQGGCLCGGVGYEVTGGLYDVHHCHCSMCRRHHGVAFSTSAKLDPGVIAESHIFVGSKAQWHDITGNVSQFKERF